MPDANALCANTQTTTMARYPRIWSKYQQEVEKMLLDGFTHKQIVEEIFTRHKPAGSKGGFKKWISRFYGINGKARDFNQYKTKDIETDKKVSEFHWRTVLPHVQSLQRVFKEASGSQDSATWKIKTSRPICVVVIGDLQLGSWGTDYDLFMKVTDEIINTPDLYVILVGDLLQMAIKMRTVLEVVDNALPPKAQLYLLDSWLQDIKHKVIASTWDNHSVMREEAAAGYSTYAEIFRRHTIYHNHIGHLDIHVNGNVYKWAVSHFFRGRSLLNNVHAPMRYLRHEAPDREIAAQGDFHLPGVAKYWEGGRERVAIVCGSIQTESGYAKRFFSLKTCPTYPCVTLGHKEKMITPYWSVKEWLNARKSK